MTNKSSLLSRLLNWYKKSSSETVDAEQYAEAFGQFKKLLLEQYQIRIQAKTVKRLPINLSAKSTLYSTDSEWANAYFQNKTIESGDIASEIGKILSTHDRLLLIGDPGVGKTTILLFAAINILMDGAGAQKLPLILNLATWDSESDFKEWYAKGIAHTYNLSSVFVEELLRCNALVPFFDGLDEVPDEYREHCLQKMAAYFGDHRNQQILISSRRDEYYEIETYAPVYTEIELQPLTLSQKNSEENSEKILHPSCYHPY